MNTNVEKLRIKINKNSPVPMYQQILNEISAYIASGEWAGRHQLPTEVVLNQKFATTDHQVPI